MKAVVLLSGGLDSTVVLAEALNLRWDAIAVSFDYGQTHRARELAAAKKIAAHYGVDHRIVGMASAFLPSALTGSLEAIPESHADEPDATTVPARNLVLLSIGAAIAEAEKANAVWYGANRDDWDGYVDCRPEFFWAARTAIELGTNSGVTIEAPLLAMTKREVVEYGRRLDAPIDLSWSCYRGGTEPCNRCGACQSRNEAMT